MVVARGNTRIFQKTGNTRGIKGLLTFTPEHVCSFIKLKSNKKYCHNTQGVRFAKSATCRNSLNVTVNYSKLIPRSFQLNKTSNLRHQSERFIACSNVFFEIICLFGSEFFECFQTTLHQLVGKLLEATNFHLLLC